jgi:signal transduction histidine kinase
LAEKLLERLEAALRNAGEAGSGRLAAVDLAADVFSRRSPGHSLDGECVADVMALIAKKTGTPLATVRRELYGRTLRGLQECDFPPDLAVESMLDVLTVFAPVTDASLWLGRGSPACAVFVGEGRPTRRMKAAARHVFAANETQHANERGFVHGVPVLRWRSAIAALVVRARPADRSRALGLACETASAIAPVLERDILLQRAADREGALVQAGERRLTRLGFDIHDGPLQEIAALGGDLRLFRTQLAHVLGKQHFGDLLLGRLDDCEARLRELDGDLRELAHSLESPTLVGRPLTEVLRRHIAAFERRSGIAVELEVTGDFDGLTVSQRLALVRLIQEALTNVLDHSGARTATVRVAAGQTKTEAIVTDDGRGFDVERTLVAAARRGRLGLVGMSERVRLLGGLLDVRSRPGGPTTIVATIPRWKPLGVAQATALGER